MNNLNLRNLSNNFQDVHLASLASWKAAGEFSPRDRGGPYVVTQEGYDPEDAKMVPTEFVLGRSGKWLPIALFYRLPVPERRAEFIFGTAAEVMKMMSDLPSKAAVMKPGNLTDSGTATPGPDEMAVALQANKAPRSASGTAPAGGNAPA